MYNMYMYVAIHKIHKLKSHKYIERPIVYEFTEIFHTHNNLYDTCMFLLSYMYKYHDFY